MERTIDINKENIVSLCPVEASHTDFLLQLFKECRPDLAMIGGINEKMKEDIMFQQFTMEQEQIIKIYPNARFNVVMLNEDPIGRLYIHYGETANRILEIGILEKYRSLGIGKELLAIVIKNSVKKEKLYVFKWLGLIKEPIYFMRNLDLKLSKIMVSFLKCNITIVSYN